MDNSGMGNAQGNDNLEKAPSPNGSSTPAATKDAPAAPAVSRAPLNLGGGTSAAPASPAAPHAPTAPAAPRPAAPAPAGSGPGASRPGMPSPGASRPGMPSPGASRPGMSSPGASRPAMPSPAPTGVATKAMQAPVRKAVAPTSPASGGRITTCKTFFTKLHPGAIEFMDEQISHWLRDNPDIAIKHVSTIMGEVQAKKTEPNILITVWY